MQGIQPRTQNLARPMQVMQVSAREIAAGGAVAALIDRQVFIFVPRITQLQITVTREQPAIACITGWHHTIEHVDAIGDALDQIFRCTDTHQVVRLVRGQLGPGMAQNALHIVFRLSDR